MWRHVSGQPSGPYLHRQQARYWKTFSLLSLARFEGLPADFTIIWEIEHVALFHFS
jgi:hypothetical protein